MAKMISRTRPYCDVIRTLSVVFNLFLTLTLVLCCYDECVAPSYCMKHPPVSYDEKLFMYGKMWACGRCQLNTWKNYFWSSPLRTPAGLSRISVNHLALQPFVGFRLLRQVSPSSSIHSCFFPIFKFQLFSMTSSCPLCLGLPIGLVSIGFQSSSFLVGLAWSILWICLGYTKH